MRNQTNEPSRQVGVTDNDPLSHFQLTYRPDLETFRMEVISSPALIANRYRIGEQLGSGAFGFVYRAVDTKFDREVAIKTFKNTSSKYYDGRAELLHEALLIGSLSHPRVINVLDITHDDFSAYMVMPFVKGVTLDKLCQGPRDFGEAGIGGNGAKSRRVFFDVLNAAQHVHNGGIYHRDLKPANIFVTPEGRGLLFDFGLSQFGASRQLRHLSVPSAIAGPLVDDLEPLARAKPKAAVGTPGFIAPELARGGSPTTRSEVFSLGGVLYCILTGFQPFGGPNSDPKETLYETLSGELRQFPIVDTPVNQRVLKVALKALKTSPEKRHQSAAEMREHLKSAVRG